MQNEHQYYMRIAVSMALASACERNKVGALLVKDRNIIAFGYNGTPAGFDNKCEIDEKHTKPEVLHAETNAIAKCARSTQSSDDAILYVTVAPCFDCAKLIIQAGICRVIYLEPYRKTDGLKLLTQGGIPYQQITL